MASIPGKIRLSKKAVLASLGIFTVLMGAGLSLFASDLPDGLEWSYAERPDQPEFKTVVSNNSPAITAVENLQSEYTPLPDYSKRSSQLGEISEEQTQANAGWTSFAGVIGSAITMAVIWLIAWMLRKSSRAKVSQNK
jgi:hypothetical protein